MTRKLPPAVVIAAAVVVLASSAVAVAVPPSGAPRSRSSAAQSLAHGRYRVGVADYTLGDRAVRLRGFFRKPGEPKSGLAPIELTGRVYYPRTRTHRPRPLVVMLHGLWTTCADRSASLRASQAVALENAWDEAHPAPPTDPGAGRPSKGKPQPAPNPDQAKLDRIYYAAIAKLYRWPCAKGTPALPSYRGYDYLGRTLASHGITAVSISANGINARDLGAYDARAGLINKHLAMWARLDRTGRGPLAGHFTAPGTARRVHPQFRHTIDLHRVGTLGHSRGGSGVFWQAADTHRSAVPRGVRIAALVSLAPAGAGGDADAPDFRVTKVPALVWEGTCDFATGTSGDDFVHLVAGRTHLPYYRLVVHGADHNFLNTQWSPSSGQVDANDDVDTPGVPRPVPGKCTHGDGTSEPELSESAERATSRAYVTAFFLRELGGQRRWQTVLDGRTKPLGKRVTVDIQKNPSVAGR